MPPKLHNKSAFQRLLRNYKPSPSVLELYSQLNGIFLVAPAATGRNTVINNLIMTGKYYFIVSDTTRPPRMNNGEMEKDGEFYWFRTEEQFLAGLERGEYLAPALIHDQQVSGINFYELERALASEKLAITDLDIQGDIELNAYPSKMRSLFMLPPEFDTWMQRLHGRGVITDTELRNRQTSAISEIQLAIDRDMTFIVNSDLESTSEKIHQYAVYDQVPQELKVVAHSKAEELINRLKETVG